MTETIFTPEAEGFIFPVSFAQQRLWFLDQLAPGNASYNVAAAMLLTGWLNIPALEQTFNEIIRRHETLRTTFQIVMGELVQVVVPHQHLIPVVDLRFLAVDKCDIQRLTGEEVHLPFDLAHGPLLRVKLLWLSETEHLLLLTMHHIVADAWSIGVLMQELAALYAAFSTGQPSPLAELPIQYADFAHWQRQWLQGEVLSSQLAYWRHQLADLPMLNLPTDRPRPAVQSYRGATQYLELSLSLTQALEALSQQAGVTLFIILLAAFQTLLYRYTGQTDIAIASPIANRNRSEIEGLIGFFVNTLVLRTDLSGNPTFQELLRRVREVALGAYAHQDLPFERLVEELQPERNLSHTPLFQVMFALQSAPTPPLELTGLTLEFLEVESKTARFDLSLSIENVEQGLKGALEYSTDLFDSTTITRMWSHFQVLLEDIVAHPEQQLASLSLLTVRERTQLVVDWNNTEADYSLDLCIHQLFEAQVERRPNALACTSPIEQLTYQELNYRANQLAHTLQVLGVGPEVLIGVCIERSVTMVVAMLAVLKAGGAYLPLDPTYPPARLQFMLEDAQVSILLTQQQWLEHLGPLRSQVICLDRDWDRFQHQTNLPSNVSTRNLAYVIYTSGSTGKPKGVAVEHGSLLNLVFWHQQAFDVSPTDRASQIAGTAFDAYGWEIFPYLAAGASIHIPDEQTRTSPEQLRQWLILEAITLSFLPTPLAEQVLEGDWSGTALRVLLTGGDVLHRYPDPDLPFTLVNHYGPTESAVVTTSGLVTPQKQVGLPALGRPIANTQVYLLDAYLQPVPIGVKGELYIGGAGLARGYLNHPELTTERFISYPTELQPSSIILDRLYKTGDLARYRPDGMLEFLGRIDEQVKIRGLRIELGEIEQVLAQHPLVQKAVVIAYKDVPAEQRLVAYLVKTLEQDLTSATLRCFLKQKLPEYMVPSAFVILEALPLTPNGKVDRRLPAPNVRLAQAYVAPQTAIEQALVGLWGEVLGVDQVGVHDNFFELGGHSLLVTQLTSRIRNAFGVDVPVRTFFEAPTAASMAEYIETVVWAKGQVPTSELEDSSGTSRSENREEVEF